LDKIINILLFTMMVLRGFIIPLQYVHSNSKESIQHTTCLIRCTIPRLLLSSHL